MHQLFFTLLLIFLPTQLGYHFWPSWAMVLGRRVDFLSPTLYLTDIFIFLILIFWRPKKIFGQRPISLWLTIPALAVTNILFAGNKLVSLYFWLKVVEYSFLGFYIIQTKPIFSKTILYLSIGIFYSSLIAIGQFLLQRSIGGPLWLLGERTFTNQTPGIAQFFVNGLRLRTYATFPHPNVLGGFLAVLLPLVIFHIKDKKQIFYIVTTVLGIVALVLTFSRSAWIGLLLGIILLTRKKVFFIPLLAVSTIVIFFISKTFGIQDESVVVRQQLNTSAVAMFKESPVFGKGLGNFLVELPAHLPSRQIYFLQPVHNIYLLVLAETGLIGLAAFLWLLWKRRSRWIIVVLLLGFADHYFLTLQQGQLLLTILLSLTFV
jgi:O-antigen ligase